jgi:hypothetical protein
MRNSKTFNNQSSTEKEDRWSWSGAVAGYLPLRAFFK